MIRILLAADVNGQAEATGAGVAIMCGVTLERFAAHFGTDVTKGFAGIPKSWQQTMQRRSREGQAATGTNSAAAVLAYWVREMYGTAIKVDLANDWTSLWVETSDPIVAWAIGCRIDVDGQ